MPFLFLLYIVAFLDRVNVGYAGLDMTRELHFSNEVFGFGAGIFFIGYVLLEVPGTLLVEVWSARKWIARILISWGLVAAATGFIQTATQFHWARFLLGVAEAGFFPGVIVYLTHWYRAEDRAKVLVSRHRDGEINALAAERLGVGAIRGSGHHGGGFIGKGGVSAFKEMLSALEQGCNVALTADNLQALTDQLHHLDTHLAAADLLAPFVAHRLAEQRHDLAALLDVASLPKDIL